MLGSDKFSDRLGYSYLLELILDHKALDAPPLHVLLHVLDGDSVISLAMASLNSSSSFSELL